MVINVAADGLAPSGDIPSVGFNYMTTYVFCEVYILMNDFKQPYFTHDTIWNGYTDIVKS